MADEPTALAGLAQATVSEEGDTIGLTLVDEDNYGYAFSLPLEALGTLIVKLLAVVETARRQREAAGKTVADLPVEREVLLPFPVVRYELGLSADGTQVALKLIADNDLVWDFVLPPAALDRLRSDLDRLADLAAAAEVDD